MKRILSFLLVICLALSAAFIPIPNAKVAYAADKKVVHVAVVGDSISEYKGQIFHSDEMVNYPSPSCNLGANEMWYNLLIPWLNSGSSKYTYQLTTVDALGGSMVYDTGATGTTHSIYHQGGSACAGSNVPVTDLNVSYNGQSRLGCLEVNLNGHAKDLDMIIFELGTNDIINGVNKAELTQSYKNMLAAYHNKYPNAALVVLYPYPVYKLKASDGNILQIRTQTESENIKNGVIDAVNSSGLVTLAIDPFVSNGVLWTSSEDLFYDYGCHPNATGQFYMADNIKKAILAAETNWNSLGTTDIHNWASSYTTDVEPTCTTAGSKSIHCTSCSEKTSVTSINALGHSYNNTVVAPTCTDGGYTTHACTRCSYSYNDTNTSALEHNHTILVTRTNATCTTNGSETYKCSRCTSTTTNTLNATGHNWSSYVYNNDASCTKAGTKTRTCSSCTTTETVDDSSHPMTNHNYIETSRTNSTCDKNGVINYKCSNCTATKSEPIMSTGHSWSSYVYNNDASCTKAGTKTRTCSICKAIDTVEDSSHPMLNHNYVEISRVDSACVSNGVINYKCSNCTATKNETINATGHVESIDYRVIKEPTCTAFGSKSKYCNVCNENIANTAINIEKKSHNTTSVITAPTCVQSGYTTDSCKDCDYTNIHTYTNALGHTTKTKNTNKVNATCTTDGSYDIITYCTKCNQDIETEHIIIPASGHVNATEIVKENIILPTCTKDGSYDAVVYCDVCNTQLSSEHIISKALGHINKEPVIENEISITCTEDGSYDTVIYCDVCNIELSRESTIIDKVGHSFTNYIENNDHTCVSKMTLTAKCDNCDMTDTIVDEDDVIGHDYIYTKVDGSYKYNYICRICGAYKLADNMDFEDITISYNNPELGEKLSESKLNIKGKLDNGTLIDLGFEDATIIENQIIKSGKQNITVKFNNKNYNVSIEPTGKIKKFNAKLVITPEENTIITKDMLLVKAVCDNGNEFEITDYDLSEVKYNTTTDISVKISYDNVENTILLASANNDDSDDSTTEDNDDDSTDSDDSTTEDKPDNTQEESSTTDDSNNDIPKTSDNTPICLYLMLMSISVISIIILLRKKNKLNN